MKISDRALELIIRDVMGSIEVLNASEGWPQTSGTLQSATAESAQSTSPTTSPDPEIQDNVLTFPGGSKAP
jgi:hypothetical protein